MTWKTLKAVKKPQKSPPTSPPQTPPKPTTNANPYTTCSTKTKASWNSKKPFKANDDSWKSSTNATMNYHKIKTFWVSISLRAWRNYRSGERSRRSCSWSESRSYKWFEIRIWCLRRRRGRLREWRLRCRWCRVLRKVRIDWNSRFILWKCREKSRKVVKIYWVKF